MLTQGSGSWILCGHHIRLNKVTTLYRSPDILDLSWSFCITILPPKIGILMSYHQISVNADDLANTAVIIAFGLFEFFRLCFRLKNTPRLFQPLIYAVMSQAVFHIHLPQGPLNQQQLAHLR
ncbi:hypothetical protein T10_7535 [Trichinella papuae]|uniref:Uncharacterized protein n=1 Tax=Trichinella papuae TaxID=268474 RepID=A0A0V1MT78_9BILA|nr:hypothetical protein T10_7535 [Trichinella papuae]